MLGVCVCVCVRVCLPSHDWTTCPRRVSCSEGTTVAPPVDEVDGARPGIASGTPAVPPAPTAVCGGGETVVTPSSAAGSTPDLIVPAGAVMVHIDGDKPKTLGQLTEGIENEAVDLEIMAHDLQANAVQLVRACRCVLCCRM